MCGTQDVSNSGEASRSTEREARISDLALRYRSGEVAVLGELYAELAAAVSSAIRPHIAGPSQLPAGMEPCDLYQQAYVELAEAVHDWQPDRRASFLPYFLRSFPWRVSHYLRSQNPARQSGRLKVLTAPHDRLVELSAATPGHDGRDWDGDLSFEEALEQLPRPDREVVHLRLLGGLTFAEIGRKMGIGQSTAHEAFQRAMMSLRATLDV